ncbi:hypothetical protein LSH36_404g03016 [Paralvinella palmiformis]|uniref:Uncharacterized protein n=1 Tax=Paralvinella palmiformis TaxID=53620 RepID=A0AAD9JC51_9ANNE|nr:hypothetical protein LSH36_404g03016 [Paralvinella palmiformis]
MTLAVDDSVIYDFVTEQSHVHEIFVKWNVSDEFQIESYTIRHQKKGRQAITYSGLLYNATDGYLITDLHPNSHYDVCLVVKLLEDDLCEKSEEACVSCVEMSTIPLIRDDSLIAVLLTLGVIVFLILIAYICWHYAKKKLEKEDDEEGSEHGSDESKQPILLSVPPTSNGPRRSVDFEDQDIPYIDETNKRDEISKDTTVTNV